MIAPSTLQIGAPAPDFKLPSTADREIALADFRGKGNVLVAFFPLAFTGTCTAEMCAFSDDYDRFRSQGTTVLPISVDSIPTLKEFKAKHGMKVDLLSDFHRSVAKAYDVLLADKFIAKRAYFLIDARGVLRWSFTEAELGHRREDEEILKQIAALER